MSLYCTTNIVQTYITVPSCSSSLSSGPISLIPTLVSPCLLGVITIGSLSLVRVLRIRWGHRIIHPETRISSTRMSCIGCANRIVQLLESLYPLWIILRGMSLSHYCHVETPCYCPLEHCY